MTGGLREAFASKDFVITAEVGPPKGVQVGEVIGIIDKLKDRVDALNVTDNQSSVMRAGSLAISRLILERGGEPILQLTGRDRNRLAIQSDLLSAWIMGIQNVLLLTGDHPALGDHPEAKPVFDLDSVSLLETAAGLNAGRDLAGNDLAGAPDFLIGAAVTPEADPLEPQLIKYEKKVALGAHFFQTQAIYDLDKFKRFMDRARRPNVKILAGILLLASAKMARYLNDKVPGVQVPETVLAEMAAAEKGKALDTGIALAGRLIKRLREEKICDGVHIMAIRREDRVLDILRASE